MNTIRILAADDSETFLRGIESLIALEPDMELVGKAHSGAVALDMVGVLNPTVVLADLRLSWQGGRERPTQGAGVRMIREIKELCPQIKTIVISSFAERRCVVRAIGAGAQGYLSKEASVEAILSAIRTAARGGVVLTHEQLTWLQDPVEALTPREKEVLVLVAEGRGDAEIARDLNIAVGTASKHVENIRRKVDANSRTEAVAEARRMGLI